MVKLSFHQSTINLDYYTNLCIKVSFLWMWRPACNAAHTVWVRVIFFDFRDLYKVKFKQWRNTGIWESHTCIQNLTRSGCLSYSIYPTSIEGKDLDQSRTPLAITSQALTCSRSPLKPGAPGPLPLPSIYAGIKLHCSSLHPIRWTNCFSFTTQLNDTDAPWAEICWGSKCFHLKWKVFQTFLGLNWWFTSVTLSTYMEPTSNRFDSKPGIL